MFFQDRTDAGRQLAAELLSYKEQRPLVLALPRGGVPVGYEIARALQAPLDILLVRKLGAPGSPEFAIGAIVEGNPVESFLNRDIVAYLGVPKSYIEDETARQTREIERRRDRYFRGRLPADVKDHTVIVVDDGIATGATMRVALQALRRRQPRRLVMAVPVAAATTIDAMRNEADDLVYLDAPLDFAAVGQFYRDFRQVEDETVIALLAEAAKESGRSTEGKSPD
jgi:putative phosphoribosyl transferase